MRSGKKTIELIDKTLNHIVERPWMHASSPEALEHKIHTLVWLRQWILIEKRTEKIHGVLYDPHCYRAYCIKHLKISNMDFVHQPENCNKDKKELMELYVKFLKSYLKEIGICS